MDRKDKGSPTDQRDLASGLDVNSTFESALRDESPGYDNNVDDLDEGNLTTSESYSLAESDEDLDSISTMEEDGKNESSNSENLEFKEPWYRNLVGATKLETVWIPKLKSPSRYEGTHREEFGWDSDEDSITSEIVTASIKLNNDPDEEGGPSTKETPFSSKKIIPVITLSDDEQDVSDLASGSNSTEDNGVGLENIPVLEEITPTYPYNSDFLDYDGPSYHQVVSYMRVETVWTPIMRRTTIYENKCCEQMCCDSTDDTFRMPYFGETPGVMQRNNLQEEERSLAVEENPSSKKKRKNKKTRVDVRRVNDLTASSTKNLGKTGRKRRSSIEETQTQRKKKIPVITVPDDEQDVSDLASGSKSTEDDGQDNPPDIEEVSTSTTTQSWESYATALPSNDEIINLTEGNSFIQTFIPFV